VVTILNQIYEVDFKGFSYGFRPGRGPHQALDALICAGAIGDGRPYRDTYRQTTRLVPISG
jgi:hypothetical protein